MKVVDLEIYKALLDKSDMIFSLISCEGKYVDVYPPYEGYETLIGQHITEVVNPDHYEISISNFNKSLDGITTNFVINSMTEDGDVDWWQNTNIPVIKNEEVVNVLSLAKNINNQMKFREDDSLLESLLSSSPDYISLINDQYEYIYLNKKMSSYKNVRFVGRTLEDIFGKDHFLDLKKDLDRAKSDKVLITRNNSMKDPLGRQRHYETRISYSNMGNLGQYIIIARDITIEKEAELTIDKQQKRISENSKWVALGEMSAGIAHEINNPLMIIKGRAKQISKLIDNGDIVRAKKLIDNISKSTDRIDNIVKGLRTYSRLEVNDPYSSININEVICETLSLYQSQIMAESISLNVNFADEHVFVEGHPGEISQVLLNLLNNAKDAISNQLKKWIQINLRTDIENVYIDIINCGEKIDESIVSKIFDPFFTTKDVGEGTGLGLSLSNTIVRNHGGELFFNEVGEYTTFTFSIPLSQ